MFPWLVQPFLYNLNIVVAEILPEQVVDLMSGLADLIVFQQGNGLCSMAVPVTSLICSP